MKGNDSVISGLQQSANSEASLFLQYTMDHCCLKRYGLKLADGFKEIGEQSECHMHSLVKRLLFLDGKPTLMPDTATYIEDVSTILNKAMEAELAIVDLYANLTKVSFDAGDMDNFHFFQHLSKWHRGGDDKFKGHIAFLQKQLWQLGRIGETAYIAEQTD